MRTRAASFVDANEFVEGEVGVGGSDDDTIVLLDEFSGDFLGFDRADTNSGVEISKKTSRGLSESDVCSNIRILEGEIDTLEGSGGDAVVEDGDGVNTSKSEVLGSFNTDTTHTEDEDLERDETHHGFHTISSDLTRVKIKELGVSFLLLILIRRRHIFFLFRLFYY